MARYEVFIPAATPEELNLTLRVTAESWMSALKIGLRRIGQGNMPADVLCDVKDDESIHVTDPRSGRVFRIVELPEEKLPEPGNTAPTVPVQKMLAATEVTAPPVPPAPESAPELQIHRKLKPPKPEKPAKKKPVEVVEVPKPVSEPPPVIGRSPEELKTEDVLIELFERSPAVFMQKSRDEGLYFLLDLAMEKIPADAGSVYVADLNRRDLAFAAVRGPKARELLDLGLRVPMGRGLAGFCAQEGVSVALSDARKDPRFMREISEKLGYETRSMLTAPILAGGRTLGALQLINKRGSDSFTQAELAILHYMALQAALYLEASD